jgi:hypothetical protein
MNFGEWVAAISQEGTILINKAQVTTSKNHSALEPVPPALNHAAFNFCKVSTTLTVIRVRSYPTRILINLEFIAKAM